LLQNYDGTVFLVSHDRTFLNNVVTSTLAWEGQGHWREYEGDIQDWLVQSQRSRAAQAKSSAGESKAATKAALAPITPLAAPLLAPLAAPSTSPKKKLSYKEQREFDALPDLMAKLEAEQNSIQAELADGSLYATDPNRAMQLNTRFASLEDQLLQALERLEALS